MSTNPAAIIGAGPAGLAAAIQLQRFGITPLVLEAAEVGGLLRNANLVENYPGFPGGITGLDLIARFKRQAESLNVTIVADSVTNLEWGGGAFTIRTASSEYHAALVVVASGTVPRQFSGFEIPAAARDKIFYEAYPLLNVSGQKIVIVGAGDAAFDYALNLSKNNTVTILNRGKTTRCLPLLQQRSQLSPRIRYLHSTEIFRVKITPRGWLNLGCSSPEGEFYCDSNYLIGAIGRIPKIDFLSDRLKNQVRDLEADGRLYFIGDVKNGIFRQTSIAVGDGVKAAMQIFIKLKENDL